MGVEIEQVPAVAEASPRPTKALPGPVSASQLGVRGNAADAPACHAQARASALPFQKAVIYSIPMKSGRAES